MPAKTRKPSHLQAVQASPTPAPVASVALYLTMRMAAARYSCSRDHLYKLIGRGDVQAVKNGKRTLVVTASGDRHFATLPAAKFRGRKPSGAPTPAA